MRNTCTLCARPTNPSERINVRGLLANHEAPPSPRTLGTSTCPHSMLLSVPQGLGDRWETCGFHWVGVISGEHAARKPLTEGTTLGQPIWKDSHSGWMETAISSTSQQPSHGPYRRASRRSLCPPKQRCMSLILSSPYNHVCPWGPADFHQKGEPLLRDMHLDRYHAPNPN